MDFSVIDWQAYPITLLAVAAVVVGGLLMVRLVLRKVRRAKRMITTVAALSMLIPGGAGLGYSFDEVGNAMASYESVKGSAQDSWDTVKDNKWFPKGD